MTGRPPLVTRRWTAAALAAAAWMAPLCAAAPARAATPDQVLVLYNQDWTEDLPGTEPGQDSEEVARHYVASHTDPRTGRKPHLLGLSCRHARTAKGGSHLSREALEEASTDNFFGVVYTGTGRPPPAANLKGEKPFLLSTLLEIPIDPDMYDWDTVTLKVGSADDEGRATVLYVDGRSVPVDAVQVAPLEGGPGKRFLADGRRLVEKGDLYLWATVKDKDGGVRLDQIFRYYDYRRLVVSLGGRNLDPDTLEVTAGDLRSAERRLGVWRGGKSLVGPHVRVAWGEGGSARLEWDGEAMGLRGEFFVSWSAKDAAGTPLAGGPLLVLDNRLVHLDVPDADGRVDWETVTLRYGNSDDPAAARTLYEKGRCLVAEDLVRVRESESKTGETAARARTLLADVKRGGMRGDVCAWVSARGRNGRALLRDQARLYDPDDLAFSRTGADGVRDDLHWLEDVERPVQAMLEDPARAVDGRPLKDHVLYIVVCYGLPRTVTRLYGLGQTAVPDSRNDAGHLVSLEQRLEMAYYEVEKVRPPRLVPMRLRNKAGAFQTWAPVTGYWWPFLGPREQPYLHPAAYQDLARRPDLKPPWPDPPRFSSEARRRQADRFLFLCSRVDAEHPETAKAQVDAAVYATRYLTPSIGGPAEGEWDGAKALADTAGLCGAEELKRLGLPGAGQAINHAAYFGRRNGGGYFPGAVDWFVISGNGCNSPDSQVSRMLRDGVTVTGGAARAYRGCAHTTTHGWWDAKVFFHYLFRGYDLGEAWMMSKYKCQWVTCLFGDPLYRPHLRETRVDRTAPRVRSAEAVRVQFLPSADRYAAVVRVDLTSSPDEPELASASVRYWKRDAPAEARTASDPALRRRPAVLLRDLEPDTAYACRLVLTDPYGNAFDGGPPLGDLALRTGPALPPLEAAVRQKDPARVYIGGPGRKNMIGPEEGTAELQVQAGSGGSLLRCGDLDLRYGTDGVRLSVGGATALAAYRLEAGRTYTLLARYRQWPLTREVWLVARDGREFLLAADNHSRWTPVTLGREVLCAQSEAAGFVRHVALYARSRVASEEGCRPGYAFDAAAFEKADGQTPKSE